MKKQIDPNLAGSADELFLAGTQEAVPAELQNSEEPFKIQEGVKDTSPDADAYSESAHHHSSSGSHSHHHSSHSSSHHHHHHHHRHGRHHRHRHGSKHKIPLWARIILVILALIIAAVGIIGGTYIGLREKGKNDLVVEQANPKYEETIEYGGHTYIYDKNKVAFAFIGVDREKIGENNGVIGTSGQADTDMVAVVDTSTGKS